jgi:hypothetical protein
MLRWNCVQRGQPEAVLTTSEAFVSHAMGNSLCSRSLTKENLQQFDEQLKPLEGMLTSYKSEVATLDVAIERKTTLVYNIVRDVRGVVATASSQQKTSLRDLNRELETLDRDREYAKEKVRLLEAELTLYRHQKRDLELTITRGATLFAVRASGILSTDNEDLLEHEDELNEEMEKAVKKTAVHRQMAKDKVIATHNTVNRWGKVRGGDAEVEVPSITFVDEALKRYQREHGDKQTEVGAGDALTITALRQLEHGTPASAPPRVMSEEESIAVSDV